MISLAFGIGIAAGTILGALLTRHTAEKMFTVNRVLRVENDRLRQRLNLLTMPITYDREVTR